VSREREWAAKGHLELAYTSISPQQTTLSKQHATCIKKHNIWRACFAQEALKALRAYSGHMIVKIF